MKNYEILNSIQHSKSLCIIGHISPDTDALSTMVILKEFIIKYFNIPIVDLFAEGFNPSSDYYSEIVGNEIINPQQQTYETAIMVDSPNLERIGIYKDLFLGAHQKIIIDHHATNSFVGNINIVEMCSSTCEIVYSILKEFKYKLSKSNQGKLYAGIITDTNNFTVGNFGKRTFKIASQICSNIKTTLIYNHFLANTTLRQMQLIAIALNNLTSFEHGQIIISHITTQDLDKYNARPDDCSVIINKLATISGNKLVCFIYPKENQLYVSMRAKGNLDISQIAKQNGGGGHKGAAAYLSTKPLLEIEKYTLKKFSSLLENHKETTQKLF
ncbi:MAG: DHH family phosphoesterase [Clostridia bacterium]|nr:DHH family phosphoesterase [Clostridia bacterium]